MRVTTGIAAALFAASAAVADSCSQDGWNNYYCRTIKHITYTNVGGSGTYNRVNLMNQNDGTCSFTGTPYSGSLAPFDEEVSIHIRGPVQLKHFAAYTPGGAVSKKQKKRTEGSKRHGRRGHKHSNANKKRDDVWVTATINGDVVSWVNDWHPDITSEASANDNTPVVPAAAAITNTEEPSTVETPSSNYNSGWSSSDIDTSAGYSRIGYYSAEDAIADGVAFLGNYGGQGSGKFTYTFGNTLSYLNADGTAGAESSTVLKNVEVGSNKEYSIWTDTECSGNDCGYYQPGSIAHHGFNGADKVFILEFMMPLHAEIPNTEFNADMPAIWLLNSLIPRTGQYSPCSCWASGCGEFDIYEVLYPHDLRAKTTVHTNTPGGSSDYFERPTSDYATVAVVFDSESDQVVVTVLDNFAFPTSLSRADVQNMLGHSASGLSSTFAIVG